MNGKDIHDAVEYVGHDLIDLAEKRRFSRPFWQSALPVAAMLAVLLGLGAFTLRYVRVPAPVLSTSAELRTPDLQEPPAQEDPEPIFEVHPLTKQFPQLDESTLDHDAEQDWSNFCVNEAGLDDNGTEIYTIHGDQVLAIDAKNGILLIRIRGEEYQGVLAIVNDPTKLSLQSSSQLGTAGETVGTIAEAHNGVLAVNASSFIDDTGDKNGGILAGYAMSDGMEYNSNNHLGETYSRLEIDSNGQFSIVASNAAVSHDVQNAMETIPAMIVGGVVQNELHTMWNGTHPRSCIGQTADGTVLILVIEGRMPERSLGASMPVCTEILIRYGSVQAVGLGSGTSAILWYDGDYVTKCSNQMLTEGRPLPNAFVVERAE